MKSCCEMTHGDVIAIEGKTLKGSFKKQDKTDTIHMVLLQQLTQLFWGRSKQVRNLMR
jgi:hypothetical protein